jgi:hypothetical protein
MIEAVRGMCDESTHDEKISCRIKERAVKLAVEADQLIAQTVRDLGVHDNTA